MASAPQHEMFRSAAAVSEPKSALNITYWICSRKVLKIPLTAGGASVASYGATPPAAWSCCMESGEAWLHEGASEPAVDICCLWPVRDRACLCGKEYAACAGAKPYAPRTLPTWFYGCMASEHLAHEKLHGVAQGEAPLRRRSCTPQFRCRVQLRRRRETCGPEHRIWPQLFSYAKCSRPRRAFPDPRG